MKLIQHAVLCTAVCFVACAGAGDGARGGPHDTSQPIVFTIASADHVAGRFSDGTVTFDFDASDSPARTTVRSLDGRAILDLVQTSSGTTLTIDGNAALNQPSQQTGTIVVSGSVGDSNRTESDSGAVADNVALFGSSAVAPGLVHLSDALDAVGFSGADFPAAGGVHELALLLDDADVGGTAPQSLPAAEQPLATAVTQCQTVPGQMCPAGSTPDPNQNCFGMCGPGASCWSRICGDCCVHVGCLAHDAACYYCYTGSPNQTLGGNNYPNRLVACIACATFQTGPGNLRCNYAQSPTASPTMPSPSPSPSPTGTP